MKIQKSLFFLAAGFFCCAGAGCASLQEAGKKIWGSSIAHLESVRSSGQSATVAAEIDDVFVRVQNILEESGAQVYLKDRSRHIVAAMGFSGHVDTTEVGVFLTSQSGAGTKVEVASMSPGLVDQVARLLFEKLQNIPVDRKESTERGR